MYLDPWSEPCLRPRAQGNSGWWCLGPGKDGRLDKLYIIILYYIIYLYILLLYMGRWGDGEIPHMACGLAGTNDVEASSGKVVGWRPLYLCMLQERPFHVGRTHLTCFGSARLTCRLGHPSGHVNERHAWRPNEGNRSIQFIFLPRHAQFTIHEQPPIQAQTEASP